MGTSVDQQPEEPPTLMSIRITAFIVTIVCLTGLIVVTLVGMSLGGGKTGRQSLKLAYPSDPDTLNILTSSDSVSTAFQRQVYEALADRDYADPDTWVPSLATHWEFDEKNLEYTIHLRRGVKWHPMRLPNGKKLPETEFTARDVKFSIDCLLNPHVEAPHYRSYYIDPNPEDPTNDILIELKVIDPYTVTIRWRKPYFLAKTNTLGIPMMPRHVYSVDEEGEPISFDFSSKEFADGFNNHWANTKMCGTGPMMLQEWKRGRRLVLVRNQNYWGKKKFNFQRIVFYCLSNPNTVAQKVMHDEIDSASIPEKDLYLKLKEDPRVENGEIVLVEYDYPGYRYIGYNLNRPIFKDVRFRKALTHAIPIDRIINEVWKGLAVPATGPFLPGSSASDDSLKPLAYDLDLSRKLLDEAGWRDTDKDGYCDKMIDGVKTPAEFDLMIYSESTQYKTVAEILAENGRKIGVKVNITPAKWALMLQKIRKRSFDAVMLGWNLSWESDPQQLWHSKQADAPDSSNHIAYRNAEVDKLIDTLQRTMNEEKQIELFHQIHRIIYDEQPYTFLFQDKGTRAYNARLKDVKSYKIRPCVDIREWYDGELGTYREQASKK